MSFLFTTSPISWQETIFSKDEFVILISLENWAFEPNVLFKEEERYESFFDRWTTGISQAQENPLDPDEPQEEVDSDFLVVEKPETTFSGSHSPQ